MKEFNIYNHPAGTCEAIKEGWSWPGLFFGPIWALVKKMWTLGAILLVAVITLNLFPAGTDIGTLASVVILGIYLACGSHGNRWREKNLISRGYEYQETVEAANPEKAVAIYLKRHASNA